MIKLTDIKGVGGATVSKLRELDINNVFELLSFFPSKYIDLKIPVSVAECGEGQLCLFEGCVTHVSEVSSRGKRVFYVTFKDVLSKNNFYFKAAFYNQPYLRQSFEINRNYRLLAKLNKNSDVFIIVNPIYEKLDAISKLSGIYTVYPLKGILGQNVFKNIIYNALETIKEADYSGKLGKINLEFLQYFGRIHRPESIVDANRALDSLAAVDLALAIKLHQFSVNNSKKSRKVFYKNDKNRILDFKNAITFQLTASQESALRQIEEDLSNDKTMSRIINGDVGSGKTVVAFYALFAAASSGMQAAYMAPTEILAAQQYADFLKIAQRLNIRAGLITGALGKSEKACISDKLSSGEMQVLFGTQALISQKTSFRNLSIAVIDEQHRFGVGERAELEKRGACDVLSLTATPIPRSLALAFYDGIDISYIEKRASAATDISTELICEPRLEDAISEIVDGCKNGEQAFIVCPAIVDSEGFDVYSIEHFLRVFSAKFTDIPAAVLHGRMSSEQKRSAMRDFSDGKTMLLIATTVIEVGIDTKAKRILIMNSDRFGLAALHQLRGRVGRDGSPARCLLHTASERPEALERLETAARTNDGAALAELDFASRGSGDFIGCRQSGVSETPLFGLPMSAKALKAAREYTRNLEDLSLSELCALTRRSRSEIELFLNNVKNVTLNS